MVAANRGDIAWAVQSAKGVAASASTHRVQMAGGTQPHAQMEKGDFVETTGNQMLTDSYIGSIRVEFSFEVYVMPSAIASLMYGVLGAKSVVGAADPWTHTIIQGNTLPYFTFWRYVHGMLAEKFVDCKIGQVVLHGEYGQPLRATISGVGIATSYLTTPETTAAVEAANRYMHADISGAALLEAVADRYVRSYDITVNRNVSPVPGDSAYPADISEGAMQVMAKLTTTIVDMSLYNRVHYGAASPANNAAHTYAVVELAGTPAGLQFTWTRIAGTRTLKIAIPRVQVDPFDVQPSAGSNDPATREANLTAYQPAAGATPITATILNADATIT